MNPNRLVRRGVRIWLKPRELRDDPVTRLQGDMRGRLIYDPADPFAVLLRMPRDPGSMRWVDWVFARELLDDGLADHIEFPTGDVQICPDAGDELRIELSSPNGFAVMWLAADRVTSFLAESYAVVPLDKEADRIDWERELALLGAGPAGSDGPR